MLLEESRAEDRHRGTPPRRPPLATRTPSPTSSLADDAPVDDPWHAAQVAGLLLARVDARILTGQRRPHRPRRRHRRARPATTRAAARHLAAGAHRRRHRRHTMIELAWRWCRTLGIDPSQQPRPARRRTTASSRAGSPPPSPTSSPPAIGITPADYLAAAVRRTARRTRALDPPRPHRREHDAARQLAARLAPRPHRTPRTRRPPSAVPPGRLRTRARDHRPSPTRRRRHPHHRAVAAPHHTATAQTDPAPRPSWSTCPAP